MRGRQATGRQPKSQVVFLRPRNSDFTTAATQQRRRRRRRWARINGASLPPSFPLASPLTFLRTVSRSSLRRNELGAAAASAAAEGPGGERTNGIEVKREPMVPCAARLSTLGGRAGGTVGNCIDPSSDHLSLALVAPSCCIIIIPANRISPTPLYFLPPSLCTFSRPGAAEASNYSLRRQVSDYVALT